MKLFGFTLSPYVRKVCAFAAEKNVALTRHDAGMGAGGAEFSQASPFLKMPALQDGDFSISDSSAIVAYLEARFPEPALIPAEPRARARTIWFDEFADTMLMSVGNPVFGNRFVLPRVLKQPYDLAAADHAEQTLLPPLLDYLEGQIPESLFLVEDRLTLADIAVASPFATLRCIDVRVPDQYTRTNAWLSHILSRPSFQETLAKDQARVDAMGGALLPG